MFDSLVVCVIIVMTGMATLLSLALYRDVINPLIFYAVTKFFLINLLSYWSTLTLRIELVDFSLFHLQKAIWISCLSLLGFLSAFLFINRHTSYVLGRKLFTPFFNLNGSRLPQPLVKILVLLSMSGVAFSALALFSGSWITWLTEPREAYLYLRKGNGHFYLAFVYLLSLSYIFALWRFGQNRISVVLITLLFIFLSLWSGKKAVVLSFFIIGVLYVHYYVKPYKIFGASVAFALGLLCLTWLIGFQGSDFNFEFILRYFHYADVSAMMLARFDEFGFYLGRVFITSFWVLVPRSLYPEKPFEYGDSLIHAVLFPGVAETGHTSGYLSWSGAYLDFGLIGVFSAGFLKGLFVKVTYETFLKHKGSIILFMLMIHVCYFPFWFFIPIFIVLIWLGMVSLFSRFRV